MVIITFTIEVEVGDEDTGTKQLGDTVLAELEELVAKRGLSLYDSDVSIDED